MWALHLIIKVATLSAPQKWMQKYNLEWLYRLMQDPKRLFTRYISTNTKYLIWKCKNGGE